MTKKIAYVYREDGKLSLAAAEYERIETESTDDEIRREALLVAAELYAEDHNRSQALAVYRRYVGYFPQPVEVHLETRNKIAEMLKAQNDKDGYIHELIQIVAIETAAGKERTPRTRFLAAKASLVLAELTYEQFIAVKLVKPFEKNLRKKRDHMKAATKSFNALMAYEIGETTAAATYYLAEIYAHFCKALLASERPAGLSPIELEQYELAIEEQAYPFEEQAIAVHEKNLELIAVGVYNEWIDKSLQKLAVFIPARYDKPEEDSSVVTSLDTFAFVLERPSASETEAVAGGDDGTSPSRRAVTAGTGKTERTEAPKPATAEPPLTPAAGEPPSAAVVDQTLSGGHDQGGMTDVAEKKNP